MVKLHEGLLTKIEVEQLVIFFREAPSPSPIPIKKPNEAKEEEEDAQNLRRIHVQRESIRELFLYFWLG